MTKKLTIEEVNRRCVKIGIKCLSKTINTASDKLEFLCPKGHTFHARMYNVQTTTTEYGCSECSGLKKLTINSINNISKKFGLLCIEQNYKNTYTPIKFKCLKCNNIVYYTYNGLIKRKSSGCNKCDHKPKTLDYYKEFADSVGIICKSKKYINANEH